MEEQHGVDHLTDHPDIRPQGPRIHISVIDLDEGQTGIEWDVRACDSFVQEKGRWQKLRPGMELPT